MKSLDTSRLFGVPIFIFSANSSILIFNLLILQIIFYKSLMQGYIACIFLIIKNFS